MELPGGGDTLRSLASNPPSCIPRPDKIVTTNSTSKQFSKNLVPGKSIFNQHASLSARSALGSEQKKKFSPFLWRRAISFENLTPEKENGMTSKEILYRKRSPVQKRQEDLITTPDYEHQSATRICQVLYLNSWRKGHTRLESIKSELKHMQTRTDSFREQNAAVLHILQAQRKRMTRYVTEKNEKSEILAKYERTLVAMTKENSTLYSKCKELEDRIEMSEKMYETEMAQKNILIKEMNKIEKNETDIQKNVNNLSTLLAALRISDYMKQKAAVAQSKQILIKEKKITKLGEEIEKASSIFIATKSNLISILSTITSLYFEMANASKKNNETADKNCDDLKLCKNLEDAFNTTDAELFAVFKEIRGKKVLAAMLSSQLHDEMEEATWRNKAYYLVSRLQALILYILTQRVT